MALAAIRNKTYKPYYKGKIDGKAGPLTIDAIACFQADNALKVTGRVDTYGPTLNTLRRKTPHGVQDMLAKSGATTGASMAVPASTSAEQVPATIKKTERDIKAKNEKLAKAIETEYPLPKEEAKTLAKIVRQCGAEGLVPFDSALAGPVDVTSDGRFRVRLRLDDRLMAGGSEGNIQRQASTKAVCDAVAKSSGWKQGGQDLTFTSSRQFACLKGSNTVTQKDKDTLFLKGNIPADPVGDALVKAACRAVENGGGDAVVRELETLSEIPKLPEAIVSAVTPPTLEEMKEAARYTDPGIADNPLANGCGPAEGRFKGKIQRLPPSDTFKSACDAHDINYSTLGMSKEEADDIFLEDMLKICAANAREKHKDSIVKWLVTLPNHIWCMRAAAGYHAAVAYTNEGAEAYNNAQKDSRKE